MGGFKATYTMKQQIFYIHGGESFQDYEAYLERLRTMDIWDLPGTEQVGKWTGTLRTDLGDGYEVFLPTMPNKNNASFTEWQIWFERHFAYLHDGVILIGCSLGAMFLMKYLTEHQPPFQVKALILMAGAVGIPGFDTTDCAKFVVAPEALPPLSKRAAAVHILHSTDDFVVPYEHALVIAAAIPGAQLTTFHDKNHFLVPTLPEVLALIRSLTGS
jgi:predicted alpha/beta hydrolase family esterase